LGRFALAVLFAYTIAHALVLQLFHPNIEEHLFSKQSLKKNAIEERYAPIVARKEEGIKALEMAAEKNASRRNQLEMTSIKEIENIRGEISRQYDALAEEIAGRSIRTRKYGDGPVAKAIKAKIKYLEEQLNEATKRSKNEETRRSQIIEAERTESDQFVTRNSEAIREKKEEIAHIEQAKEMELKSFEAKAADDFLTRSNALTELARSNWNVRKWDWLFTFILIVADVIPLFFKISLGKDEYDWMLETDQMAAEAEELIKRHVIAQTQEAREEAAFKRWGYASVEALSKDLTNHLTNMLNLLSSYIDAKMKQIIGFMDGMMRHKERFGNDGDQSEALRVESAEALRDYFKNSSEMSRDASRFFSSHFNGGHNGDVHQDSQATR
jgi:hypothetical protein